jgi:hypothetical protein
VSPNGTTERSTELPPELLEAIAIGEPVPPALDAATQRGPRVFLPAVEAEVTAASGSGPQSFGRVTFRLSHCLFQRRSRLSKDPLGSRLVALSASLRRRSSPVVRHRPVAPICHRSELLLCHHKPSWIRALPLGKEARLAHDNFFYRFEQRIVYLRVASVRVAGHTTYFHHSHTITHPHLLHHPPRSTPRPRAERRWADHRPGRR